MQSCEQIMDSQSVLVIEAGRTERHYWKDLWRYHELFYFLAWRDITVTRANDLPNRGVIEKALARFAGQ